MKRRFSIASALLLLAITAGCVETPSCGFGVDFSPDGKRIAFQEFRENDGVIAVVNTDGSGYRVIARSTTISAPIWSPDGHRLLFYDGKNLCVYDTEQRRVRQLQELNPVAYVWSADGKRVVCLTAEKPQAIWLDARSGEVLLGVDLPISPTPMLFGAHPAPIPQTWGIAFIGADNNLYTVEAGKVYQITRTGDVGTLWVSPDGMRLRWTRVPEPTKRYLVVHEYDLVTRTVSDPVNRLDLRALPHQAKHRLSSAWGVFSPDGHKLLIQAEFTPASGGAQRSSYWALFLAETDGQTVKPLLNSRTVQRQQARLIIPRWSHDGLRIAAQILTDDEQSLWVGRADGTSGRIIWRAKGATAKR